ncbi:MAG: tRNA (guanosine(46)-N7)-methyltransferase TrmB [Bacilli bacterium]|jgi:tRNA (guanine-N7-)-methyltransferase|nr:tRNA (guanosine(46)-N7)-methyltransferase TrmB [Bacilli bacterium]
MRYNVVKNAERIVDSSEYLIKNPNNYKTQWKEVFGNNNKICLELGMGRGSFIIEMAKKHPNINFIGLELDINQTATAIKNVEKEKITNLKMICADANEIPNMFGKEIDTIYLTFSEPWPKEKDAKKRFTSVNYLKLYDRIFKKNKHIIMKTDNKILFASALESLSDYWYTFNRVSLDLHSDERHIEDEEIVTDFERQYIKEKRPIYYVDAVFND